MGIETIGYNTGKQIYIDNILINTKIEQIQNLLDFMSGHDHEGQLNFIQEIEAGRNRLLLEYHWNHSGDQLIGRYNLFLDVKIPESFAGYSKAFTTTTNAYGVSDSYQNFATSTTDRVSLILLINMYRTGTCTSDFWVDLRAGSTSLKKYTISTNHFTYKERFIMPLTFSPHKTDIPSNHVLTFWFSKNTDSSSNVCLKYLDVYIYLG